MASPNTFLIKFDNRELLVRGVVLLGERMVEADEKEKEFLNFS